MTPYRVAPLPPDAPFDIIEERIMRHAVNLSMRGLRSRSVAIHPDDYRDSQIRLYAKTVSGGGYMLFTPAGPIHVKADPDLAHGELRFDEIERST